MIGVTDMTGAAVGIQVYSRVHSFINRVDVQVHLTIEAGVSKRVWHNIFYQTYQKIAEQTLKAKGF